MSEEQKSELKQFSQDLTQVFLDFDKFQKSYDNMNHPAWNKTRDAISSAVGAVWEMIVLG